MKELKIDPPKSIKEALEILEGAGYEAYLVGGCIRDYYLGKEPEDWDIATSATPEEIKKVFAGYGQVESGIKHGTLMVIIRGQLIEITTFRIDMDYSDGRRPDEVYFTRDILEDLGRRDFTMNAMAFSLRGGKLIDPFGGRGDMERKQIRSVGDPMERFTEDALRILRGIRFASSLGFQVEEKTRLAMMDCKHLLARISWERIREEFVQTLLGKNPARILMDFVDVITFLLPEVEPMVEFDQRTPYHIYNVYEHSLRALEAAPKDAIYRIVMFFHDIGKPASFSMDDKRVGHFYGHADVSAEITSKILRRMRFSNRDIGIITELVRFHHREIGINEKSIKKLLGRLGEEQFRRLLEIKRADTMAKNPIYIHEKLEELNKIEKILDKVLIERPCITLGDLAIDGNDLKTIGIPQGKDIGAVLDRLLNMVLDGELENHRDILLKHASILYREQ